MSADVVVIGGGAAGVSAALAARARGAEVLVVEAGSGATSLANGLWDVATKFADPWLDVVHPRRTLRERVAQIVGERPAHPYARIHDPLGTILKAHAHVLGAIGGYRPLDVDGLGVLTATELGLLRRADTAQEELLAIEGGFGTIGVVGIEGSNVLDPTFVAASLADVLARGGLEGTEVLPLVIAPLEPKRAADLLPHEIAAWLESPAGRGEFVAALSAALETTHVSALLLPPVLGLHTSAITTELTRTFGRPLGEVAASLAGPQSLRLRERLVNALDREGCRRVSRRVVRVRLRPNGSELTFEDGETSSPGAIVLATGKHVGGGLEVRNGIVREPLAALPIFASGAVQTLPTHPGGKDPEREFGIDLFEGGPGYRSGVGYDARMQALDAAMEPAAPDLFVAGALLDGFDPARDGTGLGCAVTTGYVAGTSAALHAASRG